CREALNHRTISFIRLNRKLSPKVPNFFHCDLIKFVEENMAHILNVAIMERIGESTMSALELSTTSLKDHRPWRSPKGWYWIGDLVGGSDLLCLELNFVSFRKLQPKLVSMQYVRNADLRYVAKDHQRKMERFLAAVSGGNPYDSGVDVESSRGLFLFCMVVVSPSIISIVAFACVDGTDGGRWAGRGRGGGALARVGGGSCGGGGGGGGGGCGGGGGSC
ncbi:hypothetical protein Ancab_011152, partial [Ancistrocladus abbreviatus]